MQFDDNSRQACYHLIKKYAVDKKAYKTIKYWI